MTTMTVEELRVKLAQYPPTMPVYTEGCDCFGIAGSLEVLKDYDYDGTDSVDVVLISRSSEAARIKADKEKKEREAELEAEAEEQRSRGLIA